MLAPAFHEGMEYQPEQRNGAVHRADQQARTSRMECSFIVLELVDLTQSAGAALITVLATPTLSYRSYTRTTIGVFVDRPIFAPVFSRQRNREIVGFDLGVGDLPHWLGGLPVAGVDRILSALIGEKLSVARKAKCSLLPSIWRAVNSTCGGVLSTSKRSLDLLPVNVSAGECDGASDATTRMV